MVRLIPFCILAVFVTAPALALKKGECEVCVSVITRFKDTLSSEQASDPAKIEKAFKKFCKDLKTKENRFCYFLGGTADAATGILGEMSKPLSWGMPADKVCEKLKKKDRQVCELSYEKQIDFKSVDLKKLKVKDLKKILNDWDENCDGCLEKADYIKRIEELKPKHVREELQDKIDQAMQQLRVLNFAIFINVIAFMAYFQARNIAIIPLTGFLWNQFIYVFLPGTVRILLFYKKFIWERTIVAVTSN